MGSFGIVWRAQVTKGVHAGEVVAVKVIDIDQFEDFSIADLRKESYMMLSSKHPNLVKEYATFIDCNFMWIVMNILDGGSLADIMTLLMDPVTKQKGINDEVLLATIMKETMKALQYVHVNGKVHRDIKAGNILLDMQGHVFLSDFGVSASLKKGQKRGTLVGSPCWMAPEIMS